MAGSLNKVMLIGRVGNDPEMRYTPTGMATTSFRIATDRRRNTPEGWKDETDWFTVVTWDKLAERMGQSLTKGSLIYVEGRLQTRTWDGQDGRKNYRTEVIAQTVTYLEPRSARQPETPVTTLDNGFADNDIDTDDIPF